MEIVKTLKRHAGNIPGWRTRRKIVVIESDDWGSIRMASKQAYQDLLRKGYQVDRCAYNRNDRLESNTDLEELFNVLLQYKDGMGNHPVVTANFICCNPDFKKIQEAGFKTYYHELFTETLQRYPNHNRVVDLYKKGIHLNIFRPQFHGREHVNVKNWLTTLQRNESASHDAFAWEMFTLRSEGRFTGVTSCQREFTDAFGGASVQQLAEFDSIVTEGLQLFEQLWGYKSETFIAPCYVWPDALTSSLYKLGVHTLQGIRIQLLPMETGGYKSRYRYLGMKNSAGQRNIVRNVFFEPSETPDIDLVEDCLRQIEVAFLWNKPAIICSHRMNFMGGINELNRAKNLAMLSTLLRRLLKKYPDVEFRSSDKLWD